MIFGMDKEFRGKGLGRGFLSLITFLGPCYDGVDSRKTRKPEYVIFAAFTVFTVLRTSLCRVRVINYGVDAKNKVKEGLCRFILWSVTGLIEVLCYDLSMPKT